MPSKSAFVEVMAKHLPPSASDLRLLDIGAVGEDLLALRPDLAIERASLDWQSWQYKPNSFDAVVAYDNLLKPEFLAKILELMREGGRLIIVNPIGTVDERYLKSLEAAGYIRILLEAAVDGLGLLLRGEKAHRTGDTLERVQSVAERDADLLDLATYRGRFLYLLIQQSPNKPVWAMKADEQIRWQAVGVEGHLLAFSSLPKAVNFMQTAVLKNFVRDINKMGKFNKESAAAWSLPVLLNPSFEAVYKKALFFWEIDPKTAELPDE